MNVRKYILAFVTIVFLQGFASAQTGSVFVAAFDVYRAYIDRLVLDSDSEEPDETVAELELLRKAPVDISNLSVRQLEPFPFIDRTAAKLIVDNRSTMREEMLENRLPDIEGVDEETMYLLLNFISVESGKGRGRWLEEITIRSRWAADVQDRRGYLDGAYLGSKLQSYQRLSVKTAGSFDGSLLFAKSAGERFYSERTSGFLRTNFMNERLEITLGDYRIVSAGGLLLSNGFGQMKSSTPSSAAQRRASNVRPAASSTDHHRFRGAAISFRTTPVRILLFYSFIPRHATLHADGSVRALSTSGYFRTGSDLNRKNTLHEKVYGYRLNLKPVDGINIGSAMYHIDFDRTFLPDAPFRFEGRSASHIAFDFEILHRLATVSGEAAASYGSAYHAVQIGAFKRIAPGMEAGMLYRNLPPAYVSIYGNAFSERSGPPADESGLFLGVRLRPKRRTLIEGYADLYSFSNRNRSPGLPAVGSDAMLRAELPLPDRGSVELRLRRRSREEAATMEGIGSLERRIGLMTSTSNRILLSVYPRRSLRLRLRGDWILVKQVFTNMREAGLLASIDIRWEIYPGLFADVRCVFFDTDSFVSRVYVSDYDAPGRIRSVALSGQGSYLNFALRYSSGPIEMHVKYSELFRADTGTIGTGLQQIYGPVLGTLLVQLDFRI